jgi:mannose/cellobiose epimerase-like protein (N-acyl-D-glucosamine 2-epimerase family)
VQPRQVIAFTGAAALGWRGDSARIVRDGMDYLHRYHRRADGLYRALIDADGGVLDDTVQDGNARLWPQTERLKASLLALELTGDATHLSIAADAAAGLARYLETDLPGLWLDERLASGRFRATPAPASSFYHLVGAIAGLAAARAPSHSRSG